MEFALGGHGVDRAQGQAQECPAEFHRIDVNRKGFGLEIHAHVDSPGNDFQDFHYLRDERIHILIIASACFLLVKAGHAMDELASLLGLLFDQRQTFMEGVPGIDLSQVGLA